MFLLIISFSIFIANCVAVSHPWVGEPRTDSSYVKLWQRKYEQFIEQTNERKTDLKVVFIGDSLTFLWYLNGKDVWDKYYAPRHAYIYGVPGDKTEHVIWRIEHGELDGFNSKLVVLLIGSNNLNNDPSYSVKDIAKGIRAVLDLILRRQTEAKVILLGLLHRFGEWETKVKAINALIAKYNDNKRVFYLDMSSHFQTKPGVQNEDLFVADKVHLSAKGYKVWHKVMEPLFKKLYNMS